MGIRDVANQTNSTKETEEAKSLGLLKLAAMSRRKSLLIGINYIGSENELQGCQQDVENVANFLASRGYPTDEGSMVILTDSRDGPFYPTGVNILAAMDWLVSEPDAACVLHYSGHGGQVRDETGDRPSGLDDTIVPVDFQERGQLASSTLHQHLVSALHPTSSLFVIFDCCHSGTAIELPFSYRPDADGNVNLLDNLRQGAALIEDASHLVQGGFSYRKVEDAQELLAGAKTFFRGLTHREEADEAGLAEEDFGADGDAWSSENKRVFMYSGCRDDQTSADATIQGSHVGAMSWAFLTTMNEQPEQTYIEVRSRG